MSEPIYSMIPMIDSEDIPNNILKSLTILEVSIRGHCDILFLDNLDIIEVDEDDEWEIAQRTIFEWLKSVGVPRDEDGAYTVAIV